MDTRSLVLLGHCEFCAEFQNVDNSEFRHLIPSTVLATRNILTSEHFVVFVGMGPLPEGYLLLAPRAHHISYAQVPVEWYPEFLVLKSQVTEMLSSVYTTPIFFEHGPASVSKRGGCCIEHAHMHAAPVQVDLLQSISNHFQGRRLYSFYELKDLGEQKQPYLFYENVKGERFIFVVPPRIPSQFLRRLLAGELGIPDEWDWALFPRRQAMIETARKLLSVALMLNQS